MDYITDNHIYYNAMYLLNSLMVIIRPSYGMISLPVTIFIGVVYIILYLMYLLFGISLDP